MPDEMQGFRGTCSTKDLTCTLFYFIVKTVKSSVLSHSSKLHKPLNIQFINAYEQIQLYILGL